MNRIILLILFPSILVCGVWLAGAGTVDLDLSHSSAPEGLCNKGEKLMFGCAIEGGNEVSICSSQVVNQRSGWIKYRFGSPGAVSVEAPAGEIRPQDFFRFAREGRFQSEKRYLRFTHAGNPYEVFEEDYMTQGKQVLQWGVRVGAPSSRTEYRCIAAPKGHLRKFEGLVPYDTTK